MNTLAQKALCEYLCRFVTERRLQRIEHVLNNRTHFIQLVLENIFQEHNASAILRTCDAFGIQNIHAIETKNQLKFNADIALGSEQWVNVHSHLEKSTAAVFQELREQGYTIVATSPHHNAYTPFNIPLNTKIALVMGTEKQGLETESLNLADCCLYLPMVGFAESFNVSVSAALALQPIMHRLRNSQQHIGLTEHEKLKLKIEWLIKSIRNGKSLANAFLNNK
jgi:tRNA (guanosine-2'-O-)-methyltransferase